MLSRTFFLTITRTTYMFMRAFLATSEKQQQQPQPHAYQLSCSPLSCTVSIARYKRLTYHHFHVTYVCMYTHICECFLGSGICVGYSLAACA